MTITQHSSAPLVAVVGATGQQGSSVVDALKSSSRVYRVRAFTRDTSKPEAQALAKDGAEVYALDVSVENEAAVRAAFHGVDIAFIMTAFAPQFGQTREEADGKLMVDAAHSGGAKRIIWSGLPSVSKITGGRYTSVVHFDGKAAVTDYGRTKFAGTEVAFVNVDAGSYAQNMSKYNPVWYGFPPDPTGKVAVSLLAPPSAKLPVLDISDYGKFVLFSIEDSKYSAGGEILAATEWVTGEEIAQDIAKASGKNVVYEQVDREAFKSRLASVGIPEFFCVALAGMFEALGGGEFSYYGGKDLTKIPAKLTTWKEWVASTDWTQVFP